MTPGLYLDDCAYSHNLRRLLKSAAFQVTVPADVGLAGASNEKHLAYACAHHLALVTKNPSDFARLAESVPKHPGILVIHRDNDVSRDMTDEEIVRAIANLLVAGVPIAGGVRPLNHWRY